jgi:hypothetical protein
MSDKELSEFDKGRQAALAEVLAFLTIMEQRYRLWSNANPGLIDRMQEGVKGKIDSVLTTRRAVEKMKRS